jgi:hypothetical protein
MLLGVLLVAVLNKRELALQKKQKENITQIRGGADEGTVAKILKQLYILAYFEFLYKFSPGICLDPG